MINFPHVVRLSGTERRWLNVIFDTILPSEADARLPLGAGDVFLVGFVDDLLAHAPVRTLIGLRLALWFVTLSPIILFKSHKILPSLSADERLEILNCLRHDTRYLVREALTVIKAVLCMAYCGLPSVRMAIGAGRSDEPWPSWAQLRQPIESSGDSR